MSVIDGTNAVGLHINIKTNTAIRAVPEIILRAGWQRFFCPEGGCIITSSCPEGRGYSSVVGGGGASYGAMGLKPPPPDFCIK